MRLLIFLAAILFTLINSSFFTQKKIWVYWYGDFANASFFYKICYEKMMTIAHQQNWTLTLVTNHTLNQYIDNYAAYQQIVKHKKLTSIQSTGDYIKFLLIQHNGGVYFDMTSAFLYGFDWLLKLEQNPMLLTNYVKGVQPEVLMFYTTWTQYRTQYFYKGQGLKNFVPGYGFYFLAGKKKSTTIRLMRQSFQLFISKTFEEGLQVMMKDDIFFRNLDDNYYLTIDRAISYTVQKQQQNLDNNLTLFGARKNANQQLKIWGLHSQDGPLSFRGRVTNQMPFYIYWNVEELKQKDYQVKFYIKYSAGGNMFSQIFEESKIFNKQNKNFDEYLQTNKKEQICTRHFIIEDSIIGNIIKQSKIAKKLNISTITLKQRDKWSNYCSDYEKDNTQNFYQIIQKMISQLIISQRIHQSQLYVFKTELDNDLGQLDKFIYIIKQNRFQFYLYLLIFITYIILVELLSLIKKIALKFTTKQDSLKEQELRNQNSFIINSDLLLLMYFPLPFIQYYFITMNGGLHLQKYILCVFVIFMIIRKFILTTKTSRKLLGLMIQQHRIIIETYTYYCLTRSLIYSTANRQQIMVPQTIFISLLIPQILKIAQLIIRQTKQKANSVLRKMLELSKVGIPVFVFTLICLFILIPNIKFIRIGDRYMIRYLIYLVYLYVSVFNVLILYEVVNMVNNLRQSKSKEENKSNSVLIIITKFIIVNLFIFKCFLIHQNYANWMMIKRRIFLDVFMILIFIIINLSHCKVFNLQKINYEPISNTNEQLNGIQQYSINSKSTENQFNVFSHTNQQKKQHIWQNTLLFHLLPFVLIMLRSIYKDNPYDYSNLISLEYSLILLNIGVIFIWKEYLQKNCESHITTIDKQNYQMIDK